MLVMSVKNETKGPKTSSDQQQESSRLFMDDIATSTETTVQTRHLLMKLIDKLKWANLMVKPEKCRTMFIKKGMHVDPTTMDFITMHLELKV